LDDKMARDGAAGPGGPVLNVRGRTADDLVECVKILAEVHRLDAYPMNWPDDPAGWLSSSKLVEAWVATLDGRIVGHVGLATGGPGDAAPKLFGAPALMVSRLFVSPAARTHGAGRALLEQAVHAAQDRGLRPVLDVHSISTATIAFYKRVGWHLLGTSEAQWGPHRVAVHSYAAPA
jgi:GNAT superfamily N-acetyltransferase